MSESETTMHDAILIPVYLIVAGADHSPLTVFLNTLYSTECVARSPRKKYGRYIAGPRIQEMVSTQPNVCLQSIATIRPSRSGLLHPLPQL